MVLDWPWNGMKRHRVGNFLLWHIDVSWTIISGITSPVEIGYMSQMGATYIILFSSSHFKN